MLEPAISLSMDPHQWEQGQRQRGKERGRDIVSFSLYILYVSGTLVFGFWFDNLHGFSGCVSILFCISFRLYRQLLFFRFFSRFFGGSEKIFCGLSKFLKNSVVVVVAFVYKQTVSVFPFCCPNQHLEYQLPSERDDCTCAREMANRGSFGLHCVRFSDALALSKLIKV